MAQYVYLHTEHSSEHDLYTVGFYDPNGKWVPESDWSERKEAGDRASYLNGSSKPEHVFPNGFTSWMETFFEVVNIMTGMIQKEPMPVGISDLYESQGHCVLYGIAEKLTDNFEVQTQGNNWEEDDWYEEIEKYVVAELNKEE